MYRKINMKSIDNDIPKSRKPKRWIKKLVLFFLLLSAVFFGLVTYVDNQLESRFVNYTGYNSCQKIWSTRGLVPEGRLQAFHGNSIETIQNAFLAGAEGTEVDLFFDVKLSKYIISHDRPYNLKGGKLLTLKDLISSFDKKNHFWLDLKKMSHLSKSEIKIAVLRLSEITDEYKMKQNIYVEGEDPVNLGYFRDAGFYTIFDTQPLPEKYWTTYFVVNIYKLAYYFNEFTVMGIKSGDSELPIYGDRSRELLKYVPTFVYHVPDDNKILAELIQSNSVKVIIMQDHSINKFKLSNCKK